MPGGDKKDDGGLRPEDEQDIRRKLDHDERVDQAREELRNDIVEEIEEAHQERAKAKKQDPPKAEGERVDQAREELRNAIAEEWLGGTPNEEPNAPEPDASDPSQLEEGQMIVSGPGGDKVVDVESLDGKPASTRKWGRDWVKRAVWTTVTLGATVLTIITVLPDSDTATPPVTTATTAPTTTSTTKTATTAAPVTVSEFSATDDRGDFEPTFPGDFEPITEPNSAGDVIRLVLITDPGGNTTSIGVIFAGSAQDLQSIPGQGLSGDVLITPLGGSPILNLLLKNDGTGKGSGLPSGMSASGSFVPAGDEFWFLLSGYVVEAGSTVSFRTIQEDQGAFSSDSVTLEVGNS